MGKTRKMSRVDFLTQIERLRVDSDFKVPPAIHPPKLTLGASNAEACLKILDKDFKFPHPAPQLIIPLDTENKASNFEKFLQMVVKNDNVWNKDTQLCSFILTEIHMHIEATPFENHGILRILFNSAGVLQLLTKILGTSGKKTTSQSKFLTEFHANQQQKSQHKCDAFKLCALASAGLCLEESREESEKAELEHPSRTLEYIYFKNAAKSNCCTHLHTTCFKKFVANEEYHEVLLNVKKISFATQALYHVIDLKFGQAECCECRQEILELEAVLFYGCVALNSHVLCASCYGLNKQSPLTAQCSKCFTFSSPYNCAKAAAVLNDESSAPQKKPALKRKLGPVPSATAPPPPKKHAADPDGIPGTTMLDGSTPKSSSEGN
jgi:hypothetical protein